MRAAQRFVLAPDAARVVNELAIPSAVERVRYAAIAPADETWLEWLDPMLGGPVGVLLSNATPGEPARLGAGTLITRAIGLSGAQEYIALPMTWNLAGPGPVIELARDPAAFALVSMAFPGLLERLNYERIGCWLVAALSLTAAPRLTVMREADLTRLNKKPRRLGRTELLSHCEVTLALGPEEEISGSAGESESERVGRALHHVRAHYRLVPRRVALVRQHRRGNARFGTPIQRHVIRAPKDPRS